MYQVWSKSIEDVDSSVHKDVTWYNFYPVILTFDLSGYDLENQ